MTGRRVPDRGRTNAKVSRQNHVQQISGTIKSSVWLWWVKSKEVNNEDGEMGEVM
jgi:hypothetical protein